VVGRQVGFKAVQYLACGVPFVVSPSGPPITSGVAGETHLVAHGPGEWVAALDRLCADAGLRRRSRRAGRRHALGHYGVERAAGALGAVLREVAG
jgi:glycosyltransferase involved in cell wall biosynthesis